MDSDCGSVLSASFRAVMSNVLLLFDAHMRTLPHLGCSQ